MVEFVFSEANTETTMGRYIVEGFGTVIGWSAVRAIGMMSRQASAAFARVKRSADDDDEGWLREQEEDFDLAKSFQDALMDIVVRLEENGVVRAPLPNNSCNGFMS